jgi:hypothetical protein
MQTMNVFQPFIKEEGVTYTTTSPKRDKAFRDIVVREYDFSCAVCKTKFRLNDLVEATALRQQQLISFQNIRMVPMTQEMVWPYVVHTIGHSITASSH